jgi:cyclophilin family peptidyl-prolyl cis-trans isomerase
MRLRHLFILVVLYALVVLSLPGCKKHKDAGATAGTPAAAGASAAGGEKQGEKKQKENGPMPQPSAASMNEPVALQPGPRVALHTNMGDIVIELYPEKAPRTVENFLAYSKEGFYNGTVFHRVIDDLLIQGGGYTVDLQKKPVRPPIPSEANNGLSNQRGTVVAARGRTRASATSEFFINLVDNPRFDYISEADDTTWGYTVFGKVVEGMNVVDKIRLVKTQAQGKFTSDVPATPVTIERVDVLPPAAQ